MTSRRAAELIVLAARVRTMDPAAGPAAALAARNILGVPVSRARDISQIVDLIRDQAARTPPGRWIITAADWHELQLAERRLPTAAELDQATTGHPVLLQRGGHNAVLNSAGLRAARIGPSTPDIAGGFIARDEHGQLSGWVQDAALDLARQVLPALPTEALATGLARASAQYAVHGLGTVRDPAVTREEWQTYLRAAAAGQLSVRSHAMIFTTPAAITAAGSVDAYLDSLEDEGIRPGVGTGRVRLWGHPRHGRPCRRGAVDAIRDAGERVGPLPAGTLVVEHGGLIAEHIASAVDLGVHITVQQALLAGLGPAFAAAGGPGRTAALFPWRELIDASAWISAGTDHPIGPLDPLRAVHGMTTRSTPPGVLGPEHAIQRDEALRLYTIAGAQFLGPPATATLVPGAPADLALYPADPFTCPAERLLDLTPAATVLGGQLTYQAG